MMLHRAVFPVMFAVMTACAAARQPAPGANPHEGAAVAIDVVNDHWSAVAVYIVRVGERRRLGDVNGSATERFYVPARLFDGLDVHLHVEPRDLTAPYNSEPLTAEPGRRVVFRVGPDVASSLRLK